MGSKIGYPEKILNLTQLDLDFQEVVAIINVVVNVILI